MYVDRVCRLEEPPPPGWATPAGLANGSSGLVTPGSVPRASVTRTLLVVVGDLRDHLRLRIRCGLLGCCRPGARRACVETGPSRAAPQPHLPTHPLVEVHLGQQPPNGRQDSRMQLE